MLIYKDSPFFDTRAAQEMYENNKDLLDDKTGFDEMLKNSLFFNVCENGCFIGIIFAFEEEGKNWIGGAAHRKCHAACVHALEEVAALFEDLYAHTRHKTAAFCLRRAGFEWVDKQKGILKKSNQRRGV